MLENLQTDASIDGDKDVLGGSYLLDSGAYAMVLDMAYFDKANSGALSFNVSLKGPSGENLKQTFWVTGGDAKGNNNFYVDQKGNKQYLPGFNQANALCLLAIGKEIGQVATDDKVINLYDYTAKKEIPQTKAVVMELIGAEVIVGVERQTVDKTKKNDQTGKYDPTGETRDINEIVKVFRARDNMTKTEIEAQSTEAAFYDRWVEKNTGITVMKAKGVTATAGSPAAPGAPAAGAGNTASLFK